MFAISILVYNMCGGFSSLLLQAEQQKFIHRLSFRNSTRISHLLFANDNLVFTRASTTDCQNLKRIFDCYIATSGQLFNYEKSSMFFSCNVQNGQATVIKNIFRLNIVSRYKMFGASIYG